MTTNKRWTQCGRCNNWQPVREDAFFDYVGTEWQECEFCESDTGPNLVLIEGFNWNEDEIDIEDKQKYEQRINNNK